MMALLKCEYGDFDVLSRGKIIASASRDEIPQDGLLAFYRLSINQPVEAKGEASHA